MHCSNLRLKKLILHNNEQNCVHFQYRLYSVVSNPVFSGPACSARPSRRWFFCSHAILLYKTHIVVRRPIILRLICRLISFPIRYSFDENKRHWSMDRHYNQKSDAAQRDTIANMRTSRSLPNPDSVTGSRNISGDNERAMLMRHIINEDETCVCRCKHKVKQNRYRFAAAACSCYCWW